ncbi:MAG: MATE family efflux transporter [Sphaerochaetaceae bacterium]
MTGLLIEAGKSPGTIIWKLAWPVILDQIFQTMAQYIDTAMVGSLGAVATAAIAVNTSTIWLVNGVMYAYGAAFSVLVARQMGAQEPEKVRDTVRQAYISMIACSLVVTVGMLQIARFLPYWIGVEAAVIPGSTSYMHYIALAYPFTIIFIYLANMLRTSGDTRSPLMANIISTLVNICGNFLLIFPTREMVFMGKTFTMIGAGLGVTGAALSTALSTAVSASILIWVVSLKKSPLRINLRAPWRLDSQIIRKVARIGTPLALERATLSFGQIALTILITHIGTSALAAHQLANTAESITYLPVNGFSIAATTLVAQSLGAQRKELASRYANRCLVYGILLMSTTGVMMYIFSRQLMGFFTADPQVVLLGSKILRIEAFAEPFFAASIVISGILRGAGDTKWPFYIALFGMWVVRLLPATLLVRVAGMGLEAAWFCMMSDLIIRGILSLIRFKRGTWVDAWKL